MPPKWVCLVVEVNRRVSSSSHRFSDASLAQKAVVLTALGRDEQTSSCWSRTGVRANFAANGDYTDSRHRPGYHDQWSVPEPGVLRVGYWHRQVEVLADGRLHLYRYCLICGEHDLDAWGTECR
jgi:hypothetical protein